MALKDPTWRTVVVMDLKMLNSIVKIFSKYNIRIETVGMTIVGIDQVKVDLDSKAYMPDQLIKLISNVVTQQIIKQCWDF